VERFFRDYGRIRDVMLKNGYGFVVSTVDFFVVSTVDFFVVSTVDFFVVSTVDFFVVSTVDFFVVSIHLRLLRIN
jgi:hypothetical protein